MLYSCISFYLVRRALIGEGTNPFQISCMRSPTVSGLSTRIYVVGSIYVRWAMWLRVLTSTCLSTLHETLLDEPRKIYLLTLETAGMKNHVFSLFPLLTILSNVWVGFWETQTLRKNVRNLKFRTFFPTLLQTWSKTPRFEERGAARGREARLVQQPMSPGCRGKVVLS